MTTSDDTPVTDEPGTTTEAAPAKRRRFRRSRAALAHIPHPPLRSKRGFLLAFFVVAGVGSIVTLGGMTVVSYTETASFCGKCHTMDPELKAFAMSPHKDLTCAECHVEPGVGGWIAAKVKGTKQLVQVITGTFPQPIPPPDHADLPKTELTCMGCHSVDRLTAAGGSVQVVLRPRFQTDKTNTRELVAVAIRPSGLGDGAQGGGVHWHIAQDVTYTSDDVHDQVISSVRVQRPDGTVDSFIAADEVSTSSNVAPDFDRLALTQETRKMDCIACHNRVGHGIPSADEAIDEAIATGRVSGAIPYIKRDAVAVLNGDYPSDAAADQAIDQLGQKILAANPKLAAGGTVSTALADIKTTYRLLATPDMKVQAQTYPDNLGHRSAPGCFRCHDGAHFKVVKGKLTAESIPSTCSTCHTFPQIGAKVASVMLGGSPTTHKDKLYVFSHKDLVNTTDPKGTQCGTCHSRTYCENCHNSGAIKVTHDGMLYNHAKAIDTSGASACAYCHQPVYCATCHTGPVLGTPPPSHPNLPLPSPSTPAVLAERLRP
jgi:nitrate/TMAO reductase-like tetraheme cytochrome c subunit